ncbi:Stage II sporulation protein R (spore_II_R) [Acididesulfobacillus acetoxydans]|uniref:Stage II sporulation protein R n=1 Tax=Acididesulfobacillus acetoxydans TaxID=1561005 RepID=A0A8S0XA62_9FIRM|nr:Stage II sporulation protein R (spore_II_R) [Acididesulfobacillus acetoxydans]CEJ08685.1 Stage II sporulation protein R [Acididesulfobacillus acetoxydans]
MERAIKCGQKNPAGTKGAKGTGVHEGRWLGPAVLGIVLVLVLCGSALRALRAPARVTAVPGAEAAEFNRLEQQVKTLPADQMIRFHVVANSDSDYDQALKRAVRDAILKKVGPELAKSHSLAASRVMLEQALPEMQAIAEGVVKAWGKNYPVKAKFGPADFPTKSYGSLVLPAGRYQAVRILIGRAQGANWWCVLFPPLCFVDINYSTAVQVDGKPGIPIKPESPGVERSVDKALAKERAREGKADGQSNTAGRGNTEGQENIPGRGGVTTKGAESGTGAENAAGGQDAVDGQDLWGAGPAQDAAAAAALQDAARAGAVQDAQGKAAPAALNVWEAEQARGATAPGAAQDAAAGAGSDARGIRAPAGSAGPSEGQDMPSQGRPIVKFWFWEMFKKLCVKVPEFL